VAVRVVAGGRRQVAQGGDAGVGHVVDDIAALLAERGRDREHALGKPTLVGVRTT